MVKIGNYSFGEHRLKQVIGDGTPLVEAYPNIPAEVLDELAEKAASLGIGKKPTKKENQKK